MGIEQRLNKKLYDPRTLEGSADTNTFESLRELENNLSDIPEFVGLDPFGSTMKGYATSDSDIDIWIYIDVGVDDIVDNINKVTSITDQIKERARETEEFIKAEKGKEVNAKIFIINENDNSKRIQTQLRGENDALIVGSLFRKLTGKKIVRYRKAAVEEIELLDDLAQRRVVRSMAEALGKTELLNLHKAEARTGETLNHDELLKQRAAMWEKRIWSIIQDEKTNDSPQ